MKRTSFRSFFMGGFECSSHRRPDGRRLDLIAATRHDQFAASDYLHLKEFGIETVRDGLRWHLIEPEPLRYDWTSALPQLRAARDTDTQVIWDLFHYGWPDGIDILSSQFIERIASFARAFAEMYAAEFGSALHVCPVNEISFLAWGGGEVGCLNPFLKGRGFELKRQLAHAAIVAADAIWSILPEARMVHIDPMIHIAADPRKSSPEFVADAERHRRYMFQAWDIISGRLCPELGGSPRHLDIIGVNYYVQNQWLHEDCTIYRGHPLYRPVAEILREIHRRYRTPILIAETGIEDELRAPWLRYVCDEVNDAMRYGVPIEGICLYPVVNHPGWNDDRRCANGLLDYCSDCGDREADAAFAAELLFQRERMNELCQAAEDERDDKFIFAA